MSTRHEVLRLLRNNPDGLTDNELAFALNRQHPHINMICRDLERQGIVRRDKTYRPLRNSLVRDAAPNPGPSSQPLYHAAPTPLQDGFWEGDVQGAIVGYLAADGWKITRVADTASRERGIDIMAEREGRHLLVEVKGWPSTTYARGDRAGQPKPTLPTVQAGVWFASALHSALKLREKHPDASVSLGFPDTPRYRTLLGEIAGALRALHIGVLLVRADKSVSTWEDDHATA